MRNSWLIWLFVIGVIITVFIAFNYQVAKDDVSLSEIFPEEKTFPTDIEYEFVDAQTQEKISAQKENEVQEETLQVVVNEEKKESVVEEKVKSEEQKNIQDVPNIPFTIQIASFKDKSRAAKLVEELQSKDFDAFIVLRDLKDKGKWYRIYVGKFTTKKEAEMILSKVKQDYQDSFIISPR